MWFTETPWPPIFGLIVFAAIALALWFSSQRFAWLAAAIGLVLACVIVWVVEQQIVTEAERVESTLLSLVGAVERGDLDATLSYISPQSTKMRDQARQVLQQIDVTEVRVTDIRVETHSQETLATSWFRANGTTSQFGTFATYWELRWQLQGGQWRATEYQRLNPVNGEPIGLFSGP